MFRPTKSVFKSVAFRDLALHIKGSVVPIAIWQPQESVGGSDPVTYKHRISIRKIARMLVGASFIPDFDLLKRETDIVPKPMNKNFEFTQWKSEQLDTAWTPVMSFTQRKTAVVLVLIYFPNTAWAPVTSPVRSLREDCFC